MTRIKKNLVAVGGFLGALLVPSIVFAQTAVKNVNDVLAFITNFINAVTPVIVGIAVFIIIVGIVRFIAAGEDPEKRKAARGFIVWGIVAVFIMISIWGLINILVNTFDLDKAAPTGTELPTAPAPGTI